VEATLAALLSSPNFLYRVEIGEADPATGFKSFTGYEMASRLSFLLAGTTPDDALLGAAEAGALGTEDGIAAQAARLLATPGAHGAVLRFFGEHFSLDTLGGLAKDGHTYPLFSTTLGAAMRGEIERTLDDVIFTRDADFRELFTTRTSFVNAELAKLYGVPAPSGWGQVTWPSDGDRAGIFGFAGVLAIESHAVLTSPTLRGKLLRERLLCQTIAPPPNNANAGKFDAPDAAAGHVTMRDRLSQHATDPTCAGCHTQMDPIGLGLEHFDAIGAYRKDDQGLPLVTATDLDGKPFDGPAQLGALLHDDPRVVSCLTGRFYEYATGHSPVPGEKPMIDELKAKFVASGYRLSALVLETVKSAGFRYAAKSE
jgi:hypothetical protein